MADEGIEDRQRDEELADDDPASVAVREYAKELHTALPGIIKEFDPKEMTAKVQPAIKRRWREAGFLPLPQLVDCPVQMNRSGSFVLVMPPQPGDECLVVFSERAIDNWQHAGGVQEPSEYRLHDYSDGFVFPGFWSVPEAGKILNFPASGCELRTLDGTTLFRLAADAATVGTTVGAERTYKADTHHAALDAYLDVIVTELAAALSALTLVPAGAALTAAQTAFKTAVRAGFATKAKVG